MIFYQPQILIHIRFTRICDEQTAKYGRIREAVMRAIKICVERNILKEFLVSRETEVIDMMDTLFNEEQLLKPTARKSTTQEKSKDAARDSEKGVMRDSEKGEARVLLKPSKTS